MGRSVRSRTPDACEWAQHIVLTDPAVAVAAVAAAALRPPPASPPPAHAGKTVVAVTSGANMNFERLRLVAELANVGALTEATLTTTIPEVPGAFKVRAAGAWVGGWREVQGWGVEGIARSPPLGVPTFSTVRPNYPGRCTWQAGMDSPGGAHGAYRRRCSSACVHAPVGSSPLWR